jgi:hypothetical protein
MAIERQLVLEVQNPRDNVKGADMIARDSCSLAVVDW